MRLLTTFPWGPLLFSCSISVLTGTAILGLGMPPKMLVPIAYGTAASYTALSAWAKRRLGDR